MTDMETVSEQLADIQNRLDKIEARLDSNRKRSKKLSVSKNNGSPTTIASEVMTEAKNGSPTTVNVGDVESILSDEGYNKSRNTVLTFMRRIDRNFNNFEFKVGNSRSPSLLIYRGDSGGA